MIQVCGWVKYDALDWGFWGQGYIILTFVCNISMILKQMMQDKTLQKPGIFFLGNGHRFEVFLGGPI